jgi:hypothetical protein
MGVHLHENALGLCPFPPLPPQGGKPLATGLSGRRQLPGAARILRHSHSPQGFRDLGVCHVAPAASPLCLARFGDLDVRLLLPPFPVFVELVCGWVLIVCHLDVCVLHGRRKKEKTLHDNTLG